MVDGNRPIAAVVFHNFRMLAHGNRVEGSIVSTSPRWCTRKVLGAVFDYAFIRLAGGAASRR